MKNITFADIEIEIKKIPVEKLSEVYFVIRAYSQKNTTEHEPKKRSEKEASNTVKSLNGCIQIEDLNDYPTFKKKEKPIVTDYASTIDQDLSLACISEPTHYEE